MAIEVGRSEQPRPYFVPDRALQAIDGAADTFEFEAVSATLADLVGSVEPPFSIAVLGPWGSGKTSLVNDVVERLRRKARTAMPSGLRRVGERLRVVEPVPRDVVVYVDTWKYESDSLRRQLLLAIEDQLRIEELLTEKEKKEPISSRLYQEKATVETDPPKLRWRQVPLVVVLLAVMWLLAIGLSLLADEPLQRIAIVLLQFATGVTLYVLFTGQELFRRITTTIGEGPLVSPEQFEREFDALVNRRPVGRLVLVLDNIDRMTPDAAIAALTTLKTYLEPGSKKGVFVIPLDDSALREHLRHRFRGDSASVSDEDDLFAREYLRKFFAATVRVPPFSSREMVAFAANQLNTVATTSELPEPTRLAIAQVLARVPGATPRRVKRHVNALSARLAVLKARSELKELRAVTGELVVCLAMLTAVEEEWPDLFAVLEVRPWLLRQLRAEIEGTEPGAPTDQEEANARERMRSGEAGRFLRAVVPSVSLSNLTMLLRLKVDTAERRIDDYEAFIEELEEGQFDAVDRRLEGKGVEDRRAHLDVAIERWRWRIGQQHYDIANSICIAVIEHPDAWGSELEEVLADAVAAEYAARSSLRSRLLRAPSIRATVWLAARAKGNSRQALLAHVAGVLSQLASAVTPKAAVVTPGPSDEDLQRFTTVVLALVAEETRFTVEELSGIRSAIAVLPPRAGLESLWAVPSRARRFIGRDFLTNRIELAFGASPPDAGLLEPLFALSSESEYDTTYTGLTDSMKAWLANQEKTEDLSEFLRNVSVAKWPLDRLPREPLVEYMGTIASYWSESENEATDLVLMEDLLRLRAVLGAAEEQEASYVDWLGDLGLTELQSLSDRLTYDEKTTGADLLLRGAKVKAVDATTPSDRRERIQFCWELAGQLGPDAEIDTAASLIPVDPGAVAAHVERLQEAMLALPARTEALEALALDAIDTDAAPEGAIAFLAALTVLHGKNPERLRVLVSGQLQQRSRRSQGESLLARLGELLGPAARAQILSRFVEDTRSELQRALREGTDWSGSGEELKFIERHRDELPDTVRVELVRILESGAESSVESVRLQALTAAIAILPAEAAAIRDAFARRIPRQASETETRALVEAIDRLGPSDDALWKLGEIADSDGAGASSAKDAHSRHVPRGESA